MAPTPAQRKKAEERRKRNLEAANISRQRRREEISSLEQERARLKEANELLRTRLNLTSSSSLAPAHQLPQNAATNRSSKVALGPAMRKLTNRTEIEGKVAVDLIDRAISGGKGKATPLDPELVKRMNQAQKLAPKDVKRPYQYLDKGAGSSSNTKSKSSSAKPSSSSASKSKSKASASKKR